MSLNFEVSSIITGLGSQKLKDRNDALEDLNVLLKTSASVIPIKAFTPILDGLIGVIELEKNRYDKVRSQDFNDSKFDLYEDRLSTAAYTLRLFVEKTVSRFKPKHVKLLSTMLMELMTRPQSRSLIIPVAEHLTFALLSFCSSQPFHFNFELHHWITLVQDVNDALNYHMDISFNDKVTTNFLLTLSVLLHIDTVGITDVGLSVITMLSKYLSNSTQENSNTRVALSLVNVVISRIHLERLQDVIFLAYTTMKHLLAIKLSSPNLVREIAIFNIMISDIMYNNVPIIVGEERSSLFVNKNHLSSIVEDYLIHCLNNYEPSKFNTECIRFDVETRHKTTNWFNTSHFSFHGLPSDESPWLYAYSLALMVNLHFKLLSSADNSVNGTSLLYKRRKIDDSFARILKEAVTYNDFLCNCVESKSIKIALSGLQITFFYLSLFEYHTQDLSLLQDSLLQSIQSQTLMQWCLRCFIPIIFQKSCLLSADRSTLLFKLCVPLLKSRSTCKLACSVISALFRNQVMPVADLDSSLLQQISDLYSLSDIMGPVILCDESFLFWTLLQVFERQIQPPASKSSRIFSWLYSKWDQVGSLTFSETQFDVFASWLCNEKPINFRQSPCFSKETAVQSFWMSTNEERENLFLREHFPSEARPLPNNGLILICDEGERVRFMYKLFDLLDLTDQQELFVQRSVMILKIIESLAGKKHYSEYLSRLVDHFTVFSSEIDFSQYNVLLSTIRCTRTLEGSLLQPLILRNLPTEEIVNAFKSGIEEEVHENAADEFEERFSKLKSESLSFVSNAPLIVDFMYRVSSIDSSDGFLKLFTAFCEGFPPSIIVAVLPSFLDHLERSNFQASVDSLEHFIQFIGSSILVPGYDSSSEVIQILIRCLKVTSNFWVSRNRDRVISADSNDIFDWIMLKYEELSFSSLRALCEVSHFMIHLLEHYDLSNSSISGGKQRVFKILSRSLERLPKHVIHRLVPALTPYVLKIGLTNQRILFKEMLRKFDPPQQNLETAAMYALTCLKLALVNDCFLTNSILHLLSNDMLPHLSCYVRCTITKVALLLGYESKKSLFYECRYTILDHWFNLSAKSNVYEPSVWNVELFDYGFDEFCVKYQKELTSFFFAKSSTYHFIMKHLTSLLNIEPNTLLIQALPLTMALSFTDGGVKDLIFDISEDLLGRKYTKVFSKKSDDFVYHLIRLTDLSNLPTNLNLWAKIFKTSRFRHTLQGGCSSYLQLKDNVSIPFPSVYKVLKKRAFLEDASMSTFEYLFQRLVSDLLHNLRPDKKIRTLRQLKLLFILFEDHLSNLKNLDSFLLELANCLYHEETYHETIPFVMDLLQFAKDNETDVTSSLSEIFRFCLCPGYYDVSDLVQILDPLSFAKPVLRHQALWSVSFELILGRKKDFGWKDIKSSFETKRIEQSMILLLSELFSSYDYNNSTFAINDLSPITLNSLIRIITSKICISNPFRVWIGTILGDSMSANGYSGVLDDLQSSVSLETGITAVLIMLFEQFKSTLDLDLKLLLDNILYLVMSDNCILTDVNHEEIKQYNATSGLTAIDVEKFEQSHGKLDITEGKVFLSKRFLSKACSYEEWIFAFASCFLSLVVDRYPALITLSVLFKRKTFNKENLLISLLQILLINSSRQRVPFLTELINDIPSLIETANGKLKLRTAIKVFCTVREFALKRFPEAMIIYQKVNLHQLIPAMRQIDLNKLALMIFEEFCSEVTTPHLLQSNELYGIYSSINETDLFYGLQLPATLSSSLMLIKETKRESYSNFCLSNGVFEESIRKGHPLISSDFAITASSNGLTGLAMLLDCNDNNTIVPDEKYDWYVKLNKWDLPHPVIVDSISKCVFSVLKDVNDDPSFGDFDSHILKILDSFTLLNNSRRRIELLESLRFLVSLKHFKTMDWSVLTSLNRMKKLEESHQEHFPANIIDTIYWSRHSYLKSNLQRTSHDGAGTMTLFSQAAVTFNLLQACRYFRTQNKHQDLISAIMELENISSSITETHPETLMTELAICCKRAAVLESARMLWRNGESTIAIRMLENVLSKKLSNVNSEIQQISGSSDLAATDVLVDSQLVEWSSVSKHRSPDLIFKEHILAYERDINKIGNHDMRASICFSYAEFCYKECLKIDEKELIYLKSKVADAGHQLLALSAIFKNSKLPDIERKDAKRHYNRLSLQTQHDRTRLVKMDSSKVAFITHALHFFLTTLVHSNIKDDEAIDKFCSLWFQHSSNDMINEQLQKEIGTVPSFKFLPWLNQMVAKLANVASPFQSTLQLTLKRMLYKLPHETLYPLVSLSLQSSPSSIIDPLTKSRIEVVQKITEALSIYDNGKYGAVYINPVQEFCTMSVALACHCVPPKTKHLDINNLTSGKYWIQTLPTIKLPLPTVAVKITCSQDGRQKERPYITEVEPDVQISSSGLSLPKIVCFRLSNGTTHRVLMKGSNDDLRQDAIMEQVFKQVNKILNSDKVTRKYDLRIRTYEVIPLGPQAGLIEFVANSMSLHDILLDLHANDELSFEKARKTMKSVQSQTTEQRVLTYLDVTERIKPKFRNFFFQSFVQAEDWYRTKLRYTKGVVTTSIVGYLLGLGDRHLNNILIDRKTGEPIHIDLGVAFDQGKLLPIPELVPFRLTRDIIDGFGVTGVEGVFKKNCERVFQVLQNEKERVMCVLNVLKWDPLYSWKMTPLKKQRLQARYGGDFGEDDLTVSGAEMNQSIEEESNNDESIRALKGVESKLLGNGLSVEAIIQEVISSATDVQNLATIYMGWSPFY